MSTYATIADLKQRVGSNVSASAPGIYQQLTDRVAGVTANDTVGQEVLDGAEGTMHGYMGRYATPIDTSGDASLAGLLKDVLLDLAEYGLWSTTPLRPAVPERVRESYKDRMGWLRDVAGGKVQLPGAATIAAAPADGAAAEAVGDEPVMTRDSLKGF